VESRCEGVSLYNLLPPRQLALVVTGDGDLRSVAAVVVVVVAVTTVAV
jgi:hypothetical protein